MVAVVVVAAVAVRAFVVVVVADVVENWPAVGLDLGYQQPAADNNYHWTRDVVKNCGAVVADVVLVVVADGDAVVVAGVVLAVDELAAGNGDCSGNQNYNIFRP